MMANVRRDMKENPSKMYVMNEYCALQCCLKTFYITVSENRLELTRKTYVRRNLCTDRFVTLL